MSKLSREYYLQTDVVTLARDLLGKHLFTNIDGQVSAGIITETEAYAGENDKASHAYGNRRTSRTEIMFAQGGTAYVYLCYGIHHLFNVVTNVADVPHAILIRGIQPVEGLPAMMERRKKTKVNKNFSAGPGTAAQALGITTKLTGIDLLGDEIWLEDRGLSVPDSDVLIGPRIGVDYAGEDAQLPYRFLVTGQL